MSDFTAMSSGPYPTQHSMDVDLVELQLQQELRSMFDVDTQQYLQDYMALAQQLHADRWTADIQEIYRTIHTIKGGAVTVGADAILVVSTVLEDLLSDLRHLSEAPPLTDGQLSQILLEAGELLVGTTQVEAIGDEAEAIVKPTVDRIQALRTQIQETYLKGWSQQAMLHQEFAQQGFGLVVLDLELLVESLTPESSITQPHIELAQQTLAQLAEIGSDLLFAAPWADLLETCAHLTMEASAARWMSQWPLYFRALKQSAYGGGEAVNLEALGAEPVSAPIPDAIGDPHIALVDGATESDVDLIMTLEPDLGSLDLEGLDTALADLSAEVSEAGPVTPVIEGGAGSDPLESVDDLAQLELDDLSEALDELELEPFAAVADTGTPVPEAQVKSEQPMPMSALLDVIDESMAEQGTEVPVDGADVPATELDALADVVDALADVDLDAESMLMATQATTLRTVDQLSTFTTPETEAAEALSDPDAWLGLVAPAAAPTVVSAEPFTAPAPAPVQQPTRRAPSEPGEVRIPVPLSRLDKGAQYLVDTLLNARSSQVSFRTLQSQLSQLLALAQESSQYITRLRQIQDDYALLDALDSQRGETDDGVALERYQQGYTTINRLLENSLRLSELGVEAEKTVLQTADSLQGLDRTMAQLQQNIEQSRLVPFKNLSFRARAILRDLTNRLGKPAQLVVHGEQMELDAGTLSKLEPMLLHLIRNALDHGLEDGEVRSQHNKPVQGTLTLSLRRRGNTFLLNVADDGGGIDGDKIRQIAESKGLPLATTETPADLLAVLCQPGFSSQADVSDVSGRGVGMDVVAKQVESLGGRLSLDTEIGKGTTFHIQFPVPHMLVPCILVQVGNRMIALPTEDITTTNILGNLQLTEDNDDDHLYTWTVQQDEEQVPVLDLAIYWQPDIQRRSLPETALCVAVKHPDTQQTVWLLTDDLREQTDLLINPLPEPMLAPQGLVGVSLLPDGKLAAVLEPAALAELVTQPRTAALPPVESSSTAAPTAPNRLASSPSTATVATRSVLIVDDAALMRRRLEASLRAYGYDTHACTDGLDAWNWLQANPTPALVITDVEMPHMDGFTLIDRCRQAGMEMPMLVVSSRLAEEWSKEAKRLGATDYLTKGFSTPDLIEKVKTLMA